MYKINLAATHRYLMTHHDPSTPSFAQNLYRMARGQGIRSPLLQSAASHGDDVMLIFNFPHNQVPIYSKGYEEKYMY